MTTNLLSSAQAQQDTTQTEQKNIQTRDQIIVLLEGKSVNPNSHIHLYDTGSYHIMDGHVSVNIPCNENSEPLLEVMGGIAGGQYFMKKWKFILSLTCLCQDKHVCIMQRLLLKWVKWMALYRYNVTKSF